MPIVTPLALTHWSSRRRFVLHEPWTINTPEGIYPQGKIYIPEGTEFDGASIPCPWLLAALTNGLIRPDGVLFIPALVHDFAYQHGGLIFERDGLVFEPFTRLEADRLFRDIVAKDYPLVALLAWVAVRLGNIPSKYPTLA